MNPKIERDPYLRLVAQRWGEAAVIEAGWFDDGDPTDAPLDDVGWLCTPVDVVARNLAPTVRRPVVLVSTGGFFPVHDGHVAMMDRARRAIDEAGDGRRVVGGYLSPAHDDYIRLKCGSVDRPVSTRLAAADAAVAPTGWLSIDPWEALARHVAVNYTDVTARLEAYLHHHLDPTIEVIYVCGGDNARFALAFAERGGCVVIGRPGCEATVDRWRTDPRVAGNSRILFVGGDDPSSSSALRPPATPSPSDTDRAALTLRLEDGRAVATLGLPTAVWRSFQAGLVDVLAARVMVRTTSLEDQHERAKVAGTVSLDPMLPAEIDLAVSRLFDLGGYRARGHTARPGSASLDDQLAAIPRGRWTLRDDDRSTGATVRFVTDHLPAGVSLTATTFSLDPGRRADGDIADSRDFLLGTDDGGLVVALPRGEVGRAPYLLPYVDPSARSSLPGDDAVAFSIAVWDRNALVFASTDLVVADLPPAAARTMAAAGFAAMTPLVEVCRHHATVLRTFVPH